MGDWFAVRKWEGIRSFFYKVENGDAIADWREKGIAVGSEGEIAAAIDGAKEVGELEISLHRATMFGLIPQVCDTCTE